MFGNLGNVPKIRSDIELTSIKVGNSAGNGNKSASNTPNISSKKEVVILGYSLDHLSRGTQLTICVSGVFFFYLVYGYVQVIASVAAIVFFS